jgi:hypothetical protein
MARRRYSACLSRHWSLAGQAVRIDVQHIQSGACTTVATLRAAAEWIGGQAMDGLAEPAPRWPGDADPGAQDDQPRSFPPPETAPN